MITRAKISGDEGGSLILDRSEDGDVWVTVLNNRGMATLRFCTVAGGGKAPNTRAKLYELMDAIKADGGDCVEGDET